jgi:signal peptidase I
MPPVDGVPAPDAESGAGDSSTTESVTAESGAQTAADQPETRPPSATSRAKKRKRPLWRDLFVVVIVAIVLTVLLKAFVVQVFSIPSGSMENTLLPGDRILVSKIVYRFRPIARGDVVVFSGAGSWDPAAVTPSNLVIRYWDDLVNAVGVAAPGTDYVKRVIGIPGDHVKCCDAQGRVTVNGAPLNEKSYIYPGDAPSQVQFNITVPPGRLWVMGDNRADSDDSRYRPASPDDGTIPETAVVGRAFVIIWPLSRINDIPIPTTFAQTGLQTAAAIATAPPATLAGGAAAISGTALAWRRRRKR